jgi:hypothetical protein
MDQYYFKITASYTDKNKLYKAFSEHVHELDGTLIQDEDTRQAFTRALQLKMDQLNKEHSRCKPLELTHTNFSTPSLSVTGSWTASLYKIKRAVELKEDLLQYFIPHRNH